MALQLNAMHAWKILQLIQPHRQLRICANCAFYLRKRGFHVVSAKFQIPAEKSSTLKNECAVNNKGVEGIQNHPELQADISVSTDSHESTLNPVNIQMLAKCMQQQLFKDCSPRPLLNDKFQEIVNHLSQHELWGKNTKLEEEISFQLPKLHGENIEEHFYNLAKKQTKPYFEQAESLANITLPPKPSQWIFKRGWTKYDPKTRTCKAVDCPDADAMVFDVEVVVGEGNYPTMATAVSENAWYSWCSNQLVSDQYKISSDDGYRGNPDNMVPMETAQDKKLPTGGEWLPKLVVGHNVGFDRSFIKEQYHIKGSQMRFLDTMSMHISVSGLTSLQRMLYMAHTKGSQRKEVKDHAKVIQRRGFSPSFQWTHEGSLNNLADVHKLYCKATSRLDKDPRNIFVKGTMEDVRKNFQELMTYCATDVSATHEVFSVLWPLFLQRMPHPVTLAGMLEMGTTYLPLNNNWPRYLHKAQTTYANLAGEISLLLQNLANQACQQTEQETYKNDVWLWDLDWTVKGVKKSMAKEPKKKKKEDAVKVKKKVDPTADEYVDQVYKKAKKMLRQPYMAGYPLWYVDLCPPKSQLLPGEHPQPTLLSTQRRATPKLLRLTWDGFPLHYHQDHGWGFLVPDFSQDEVEGELQRQEGEAKEEDVGACTFPYQSLIEVCRHTRPKWLKGAMTAEPPQATMERVLNSLHSATGEEEQAKYWAQLKEISDRQGDKQKAKSQVRAPTLHVGAGPFYNIIPGCLFYRLPHKDGGDLKVGNPLAKDFLGKIEDGILSSYSGSQPQTILKYSNMTSYWKNNMDRIGGQMAVQLRKKDLPSVVTKSPEYDEDLFYGAIVPRIVPAGTVTRRAVEKTWLTASNAYNDRVGSELKAMVQSPPGYHFVGADVDSQELWIAAILGDAYFAGQHGCTAFGWMTLQGNKVDGTDLHSKTASIVGISRDQAKVFNYGRIYGAGANFAERLLMQFNSRLTPMEARNKAQAMYQATKGKRVYRKPPPDEDVPREESKGSKMLWDGGSESHMFNMLESIALSEEPRTPVLGCLISKALQPQNVSSEFMTSRINWVVQSSAVDYLHLMLVTMRWLFEEFNIDGRFCISIHDEVRYLVQSEDRYRAALALQITNLLTRAMFARKLGMNNLPQSVAFFSAVDIDKCLRKETHMDCVTPSNPRGLKEGYGIPPGEALTMQEILKKTNSSLLSTDQPKSSKTSTKAGNQLNSGNQCDAEGQPDNEQASETDNASESAGDEEGSAEKTKLRGYKKHSEHEVFPILE